MRLATAEQMRHIDSVATREYAVPGVVLMENAGRHVEGVVAALAAEIGPGTRVLVIAGKGNNGGDGFVVARHLRNRGIDVRVCLLPRGTELVGDAALNYEMAVKLGVPIVEPADAETIAAQLDRTDIVVDAILGTGIHGEVTGPARVAIETLQDFAGLIVSVDIPSGIDADTGAVCGAAVRADITVTFGLAKTGLCQAPGSGHAGQVEVVDISLPRPLLESETLRTFLTESSDAAAKLPPRWGSMHKGDAGRVFVIAGSEGMTGAAAMSSEAAHRSGAGLVTVGVPRSLNDILECKITEVMSLPLPETEERCFSRAALEPALKFANGCEVAAIGPGLGTHPETRAFVREFVRDYEKPLVIDADGLNAFADGAGGPGLIAARDAATVITPHPGELARLFAGAPSAPHWAGSIAAIQANRVEAAREAAGHLDCVVVLKGAGTVIADPSGQAWINSTGNEGMAKGGSGDVLTGIIAGLLAGGATPLDAAIAGVYYHGLAGDLAAAELGARGMIAGDILRFLPKAWQ
jgi:NAD(P)H-hydrate epimerase